MTNLFHGDCFESMRTIEENSIVEIAKKRIEEAESMPKQMGMMIDGIS